MVTNNSVVALLRPDYERRKKLTVDRDREQTGVKSPGATGSAPGVGTRLARLVGRTLLWGCVLLLLVRGVGAILARSPEIPRPRTVTVIAPGERGNSPVRER